jgi:hypothetical protein
MASKKFSRLSILLEARDKMTNTLNNASRASQSLAGKVNKLSDTFEKNKGKISDTVTQQKILANGYAQLGKRLGVTQESVKQINRAMDKAPNAMKKSALGVKVYNKSLLETIANTRIGKATNNLYNDSMSKLRIGTKMTANSLTSATKWMWNFSRAGKAVSYISPPFKALGNEIKMVARNTSMAVKNSFGFKVTQGIVKALGKDIKMAGVQMKTFVKDVPTLAKYNRVMNGLRVNIGLVKNQARGAALAFNIWKNTSPMIESLKNKFTGLKGVISKLASPITKNVQGLQKFNQQMSKTGGKGRATFNQLADANAKLNKEIAKMNRELSKANSKLGSMKSSLGSLNHMGAAFGTAYAAQAAYGSGERVVQGTIGTAMEQQYSAESVGILAGAENGAKFWEQIQSYAASTAYAAEDWGRSMRGAISKSKNVKDLEKYQIVLEQLATLDPIQGLDGAALAVRELNSGDTMSLVERFELPRSALKDIKNIEDPIEQIQELSKLIGESTGYTVKNVQKMKELPLMQWQKMTNLIKTGLGYIGAGALTKVAPLFEKFNEMWDAGKFKPFIKTMSDGFEDLVQKTIDFVSNFGKNKDSMLQTWEPTINLIKKIKDTFVEAWPTIKEIGQNLQTAFNNVSQEISNNWPLINDIIQKTLDIVKDFTGWVNDNWPWLKEVIIGVGTALGVMKILGPLTPVIEGFYKAVMLMRGGTLLATAAQWALNTALLANPIGLVILGIGILVGLAVALWRNYDVVVEKLGRFRFALYWLGGPLFFLIAYIIEIIKNWDNFQAKIDEVAAYVAPIVADIAAGIGRAMQTIQDAIQWVIDKWEGFKSSISNFTMPKFNIPGPVGTVLSVGSKLAKGVGGLFGRGHHGGLDRVPYDGYEARLHKDERVLTRQENKDYENGNSKQPLITGNTFVVREEADIDRIADQLFKKLAQQMG